jgi:hypothetical protein
MFQGPMALLSAGQSSPKVEGGGQHTDLHLAS